MKVVILAGGFGTRLSENTEFIPKPLVRLGDLPILVHVMDIYSKYGFTDFVIALGYKGNEIKNYFLEFLRNQADITINFASGETHYDRSNNPRLKWNVSLVDTGLNTLTGLRLKKLQPYLEDAPFLLTYGDGVSDVKIDELVEFHNAHGKMLTVTAVKPPARFGEMYLKGEVVTKFREKQQMDEGWINGGFFVVDPRFFSLLDDTNVMLEREPLISAAESGELMAFRHEGFWQCMDTKKELKLLDKLATQPRVPWIV